MNTRCGSGLDWLPHHQQPHGNWWGCYKVEWRGGCQCAHLDAATVNSDDVMCCLCQTMQHICAASPLLPGNPL